ncbi:30S ribosomal protein S12 methylthiotransferase RimO [Opitutus terrae]|uniref:Ribosomal protein uS12 methylthiotransferase RimO n=1 Tax=Opitutus terrae (strain DSM 11246 / JCM 15787 / PB90-1) TaxID=452637 RepID=RIMO_OPITP|nr:30S ribosomal protein S12 methylthiotransferase RimO [Opitutus terrae]B1ZW93.1 RecName: Full=Ribosomal protein uS12 methylthiotransferase RimO; Short=uS12 MTTase; Short=uS12 methylthiotransferase; AltName: Full=Ribosomal protein uS12 (aspartate-C(3))-methylthiotransferase; AltName: Full=Ribosome maturation factor RimO [Opitutus terrae PB90-1]ACB76845.1 MiaB-like tRNA modifying enzyme YliG [Opitutus terrae PB90-1]
MIKVSLISLGCAKNLVDSEIMVGHLHQAGMAVIPEAEKADVVIVNTCSFIDSSKEESIGHILEVHQHRGLRKRRKEQKLIVAGCMSQRFSKDLSSSLHDEVDAFIGLDQVTKVAPIIQEIYARERTKTDDPVSFVEGRSTFIPDYDTPRFRLTPKHFAYVKIAEGCNHPCTFCIIPQIRGRHRSRTVESVVAEVRQLVREGVKEINLISQDTTFFGMDTWEQRPNPRTPVDSGRGTALTTLLRQLNAIEGDFWIRLLYTHPAHWSDELIRTIAECPKVARYIDIPLQHISDAMLSRMQRETSGGYIRDLIARIRAGIPGIAVRTTFIVGFPGETDADVDELCAFISETKFERLGVFRYSQEDGTRAAKMPEQLSAKTKEARWHRTMALQKQIAADVSKTYVGRTLRVLVEEPGVARGEADAPDIDGRVYVPRELPVGEFADVTVTGYHDYDLLALPPGQKPAQWKVARQAQ